ncbi:MAG: FCD domain-containing protein, partial [Alphaproteobacteria bacterium]|nr:FCD domain-containing protein [Alphaproteobacteria bacterium]
FHDALFAGVNQLELSAHLASRCGHLGRARSLDLPRVGKMSSVLEDHQAIITAIEEKNVEKSIQMMREHLSGTMERLPQIIAENKELFS